jgi:hypothetical protein
LKGDDMKFSIYRRLGTVEIEDQILITLWVHLRIKVPTFYRILRLIIALTRAFYRNLFEPAQSSSYFQIFILYKSLRQVLCLYVYRFFSLLYNGSVKSDCSSEYTHKDRRMVRLVKFHVVRMLTKESQFICLWIPLWWLLGSNSVKCFHQQRPVSYQMKVLKSRNFLSN